MTEVASNKRKATDESVDRVPTSAPKDNKMTKKMSAIEKIVYCLRELKAPGGSSLIAVRKMMLVEFGTNSKAVKNGIDKGINKGILTKTTPTRIAVIGDPEYEDMGPKVTIEDKRIGNGKEVLQGSTVTIAYIGSLQSTGHVFDSGSIVFTQGNKDVIKGMDQGILNMKIGGKRVVTIPPELGYGKRGSSPDIPGDSVLVFEITLKGVM
jgi:hypothetical protein